MHMVTLTGHGQMAEVRRELMLHNRIRLLPCLIDEQTRCGIAQPLGRPLVLLWHGLRTCGRGSMRIRKDTSVADVQNH